MPWPAKQIIPQPFAASTGRTELYLTLLLLGTNDVFGSANATVLTTRMEALLDIVFATLPDVRVLLGGTTQPVSRLTRATFCSDLRDD